MLSGNVKSSDFMSNGKELSVVIFSTGLSKVILSTVLFSNSSFKLSNSSGVSNISNSSIEVLAAEYSMSSFVAK